MKDRGNPADLLTGKTFIQLSKIVKMKLSRAETTSLYSVPETEFGFFLGGLKGLTAREAIGLVIVASSLRPTYYELLLEKLGEICYSKHYEGLWRKLHKLIRVKEHKLILYLFLEEIGSKEDLFGNYINLGLNRIRKVKLLPVRPKKATKPQFRRGYNDHGSRRDESQWLPTDVWIGSNPEKEDYTEPPKSTKERILHFLFS